MATRFFAALCFVLLAGDIDGVQAQTPVVTVITTQASLAENPNLTTRTTTTLSTTTSRFKAGTFSVRIDLPQPGDLAVQYNVSGSASAGRDYQALSGSVTIPAGKTSASITVSPIDDQEAEADETVSISIVASSRSGYTTARPSVATTTIVDDEAAAIPEPAVSRVSTRRADVFGGQTVSLSVALDGPAPPGGLSLPIALAVQSPAGAAVPASPPRSLSVPAGSNAATLSIPTRSVSTATRVAVTIGTGSNAGSTTIGMHPAPVVQNVSVTPDPVSSSDTVEVTVRLAEPVPPVFGGTAVYLNGSGPVSIATDTHLPIPVGAQEAKVRIGTVPVAVNTTATVRAGTAPGSTNAEARSFTVTPPVVVSVTSRGQAFFGGETSPVTVSLSGRAPAAGLSVPITLSTPGGSSSGIPASAPATFTIPGDLRSIAFSLATNPVTTRTLVVVTAGTAPSTRSDTIELHPRPMVASVEATPGVVPSGDSVDLRIRLDVVNGSYQTIGKYMTGTGPVVIPSHDFVSFPPGTQEATVRLGASTVANSQTAEVRVSDRRGQVGTNGTSFVVTPPSVTHLQFRSYAFWGGWSASGLVEIGVAAPPGGLTIPIAVSAPGIATAMVPASAPATVTIPAGSRATLVPLSTQPVTTRTDIVVTAGTGSGAVAVTLELHPHPKVETVSVTPDPVTGGETVDVRVRLDVPNGTGFYYSVWVTGSGPIQVPTDNRLTFARGVQEQTLRLATNPVGRATVGKVYVSEDRTQPGSETRFTVGPPPRVQPVLESLSLNPARVTGGTPSTATASLSLAAPAGGLTVTLSSSDPATAAVPASVTIGAGASSATFPVTTSAVTVRADVRITASMGGQPVEKFLRVDAPTPPTVTSIAPLPTRVISGAELEILVQLSRPADRTGMTVSLTSTDPAVIPAASVQIAGGQRSGSVRFRTPAIDAPRTVRVGAGPGAPRADIELQPLRVDRLQVPRSVRGGDAVTVEVRLRQMAPDGGLRVPLASSDPSVATVPAFVDIPAGEMSATFTAQTRAGPAERQVTVSAGVGATAASQEIRVR